MIARAERELEKDLGLSELQAIDRVQKLHRRFEHQWIGAPWLVLPDTYCCSATMPVHQMLESIAEHGQPCGIVGLALLPHTKYKAKSPTYRVLKMFFRKSKECRAAVNLSADTATDKFLDATAKIRDLHLGRGDS
jgi:hypothetical protein